MDRVIIKEIKPAGNWKWELQIENRETIAVIIGWNNMEDADNAVIVYESSGEINYRRWGNVTGYVRSSKDSPLLRRLLADFTAAAGGNYGLLDSMKL